MNNMPPKLRKQLGAEPYYRECARQAALQDHECKPNPMTGQLIEWEHAIIIAGKQVQERFAVVPLCWWAHSGPGLDKHINLWIALNRATDAELLSISRAFDYFRWMHRLNDQYGRYVEPEQVPQTGLPAGKAGIMYPWLCSPHSLV